jgi:hypothetical protein
MEARLVSVYHNTFFLSGVPGGKNPNLIVSSWLGQRRLMINGKIVIASQSFRLSMFLWTCQPHGDQATIEQVSTRVTVGHVGEMRSEYVPSGIPFLRSQNVRPNRFDSEGLVFIRQEFHAKLAKSKIHPGDVVVVRSGNVGTTCVIPESVGEANCSDLVLRHRHSEWRRRAIPRGAG